MVRWFLFITHIKGFWSSYEKVAVTFNLFFKGKTRGNKNKKKLDWCIRTVDLSLIF